MKNKEHVLLCIMAESASGKDTLANMLCERNNYNAILSHTTRPRRNNEGETHVFVTDDIYNQMLQDGQVAAHTVINGYHYWCTKDQLYSNDIYVIDPSGIQTLKTLNLPNLRLVTVYINVPEEIRKERALSRGDDINVYRSRTLSERQQFRDMKKNMNVDYVVPNLDCAKAYSVLKWISKAEGLWKNHMEDISE
jgi:guanylate kinase